MESGVAGHYVKINLNCANRMERRGVYRTQPGPRVLFESPSS